MRIFFKIIFLEEYWENKFLQNEMEIYGVFQIMKYKVKVSQMEIK
jgi:hypothetical protein